MHFILDKFRAKIASDTINKSIYIYMNQRSLRRAAKKIRSLEEYTEGELEELEDKVVELIEAGGSILAPFNHIT